MNICFHKSYSNCKNIDKDLYICGKINCARYKAPNLIYNSFNNKTPLTFKSILWFIIETFKFERKI